MQKANLTFDHRQEKWNEAIAAWNTREKLLNKNPRILPDFELCTTPKLELGSLQLHGLTDAEGCF